MVTELQKKQIADTLDELIKDGIVEAKLCADGEERFKLSDKGRREVDLLLKYHSEELERRGLL